MIFRHRRAQRNQAARDDQKERFEHQVQYQLYRLRLKAKMDAYWEQEHLDKLVAIFLAEGSPAEIRQAVLDEHKRYQTFPWDWYDWTFECLPVVSKPRPYSEMLGDRVDIDQDVTARAQAIFDQDNEGYFDDDEEIDEYPRNEF